MVEPKNPRKIRILYLHGFEENRESVKPAFVRHNYGRSTVMFPDLGMYLTKWNSPVRYGLLSRAGLCGVATGVVAGMLSNAYVDGGGLFVGLAAAMAVLCGVKETVVRKGVEGSFAATKEIAIQAIKQHKPDLIIGFSWGGALALDLVATHDYSGPLLLLAPAYHKLYDLMGKTPPSLSHNAHPIHIIHSKDDLLCPIEQSKEIAAMAPHITVQEVDQMGHRLWELCDTGDLIKGIEGLTEKVDHSKR
eukprot:TRINITY_DN46785_c0_g1_i1.p1 TRINITY_DN46785_c0_g1~~TRINITY_DN46785_c0_g1_i1.p1  ORF type:complete len:257 (+),score=39.90 TRINITY_DN46785_c0_g1_i1:29-772(+)